MAAMVTTNPTTDTPEPRLLSQGTRAKSTSITSGVSAVPGSSRLPWRWCLSSKSQSRYHSGRAG